MFLSTAAEGEHSTAYQLDSQPALLSTKGI